MQLNKFTNKRISLFIGTILERRGFMIPDPRSPSMTLDGIVTSLKDYTQINPEDFIKYFYQTEEAVKLEIFARGESDRVFLPQMGRILLMDYKTIREANSKKLREKYPEYLRTFSQVPA